MFPNDNICTVKAAKKAAKSILEKYTPVDHEKNPEI